MAEHQHHPLDDFDLEAFFSSVDKNGLANTLACSNPPEVFHAQDPEFTDRHKKFQRDLLIKYFKNKKISEIRAMAAEIKQNFEADKQLILTYSDDELQRRLYKETTLDTLVNTCDEQFKLAVKNSGSSLPNSKEEEHYRKQAGTWNTLTHILQAAREIE